MKTIFGTLCIGFVAAAQISAQQQQSASFTVGSATAQRGTTAAGVIAVPAGSDSALDIPGRHRPWRAARARRRVRRGQSRHGVQLDHRDAAAHSSA